MQVRLSHNATITSYYPQTYLNLNTDRYDFPDDTRRDMAASVGTAVPPVESSTPEPCYQDQQHPGNAGNTGRTFDKSKILRVLATETGAERFTQFLLRHLEKMAQTGQWGQMKWLPVSKMIWWRTSEVGGHSSALFRPSVEAKV